MAEGRDGGRSDVRGSVTPACLESGTSKHINENYQGFYRYQHDSLLTISTVDHGILPISNNYPEFLLITDSVRHCAKCSSS